MKKPIIIFSIIVIVLILLLQVFAFFSNDNNAQGNSKTLEAIRKAGLSPIGSCDEKADSIDGDLDWAMINAVCQMGGYDLGDYFGKTMLISSCPIEENYVEEYTSNEKHPLKARVFSDSQVICVYVTHDREKDSNPLIPGIYPINDQFIKK